MAVQNNTCPNCGQQLNPNAQFCPKCGAHISAAPATPPAAPPPAPYGGTPPTPAPQREQKPSGQKGKGKAVALTAIFLVLCLALAGGGYFLLQGRGDTPDDPGEERTGGVEDSGGEEEPLQVSGDADLAGEAMAEVLEYIDKAEETVDKAYDEFNAINEQEYYLGQFRDEANVLEKLVSDVAGLREKANSASGFDANFAAAEKEYFNMMYDSQSSFFEIWNFLADYFDFCEDHLYMRPLMEDYGNSIQDFYNDLYTWHESVKEAYSAISSCPACMESKWKQYGEALDLSYNIAYKTNVAAYYTDWLSFFSAQYLTNRFETEEDLLYNDFLDSLIGEREHVEKQLGVASALADEIRAYAELGEEEREGYEFEYIRTGKIYLSYDAVDTIYPSLYNTYEAFVIVKTGSVSGTRKIVIEAEIPGFTQPYTESFTLDSSYQEINIKPPLLTGDLGLSAAKDAQISIKISEQDGTLIEAKSFPITIKSKNDVDWYSDEYGLATRDNILCFLTPESSAIADLKRAAIDEISSLTGGQMESFVGYQGNAWNNHYVGTYLQAAGIMRALNTMGVRYNNDVFSISGSNQHVLYPEEVLSQRSGLCVETALVVASALQSAGMHAYLVFPPGHAQVAVEIWNGSGNDTTGTGEYFLIETTALDDSSNYPDLFVSNANDLLDGYGSGYPITYYSADSWYDYIMDNGAYVIDCDDASTLGLTPFAN